MLSFCENVYIITLKYHLVSIQMNNFKISKLVSNIIYSHDVHISYTYFASPPLIQILALPLTANTTSLELAHDVV